VSEHNEQLLADQDLRTNDTVLLHWNETSFKIDFVQSHAKAPLVSSEGQSGSCVRLFASPSRNVTAHCNAKGTPAQGWYANGKLIQYDTECDSSTLACGVLGQEGWFAQEKQNRSAVQYERCSWQTQLPVCKENQQGLGWYLDNRLVAKDHDCRKKAIECGTINGHEAWVAYVRSAPKLYSAQSCIEAVKQELQKAPRNRSDIAKR